MNTEERTEIKGITKALVGLTLFGAVGAVSLYTAGEIRFNNRVPLQEQIFSQHEYVSEIGNTYKGKTLEDTQ